MSQFDHNTETAIEAAFTDETLSLRAKGMIALLAVLPDGYSQTEESLAKMTTDGRDAEFSAGKATGIGIFLSIWLVFAHNRCYNNIIFIIFYYSVRF